MLRLLGLRAEDRREAAVGFFALGAIMAAHAMLETARDTLFLTRLPASDLPICYLAIAALAVIAVRVNQSLLVRVPKRRLLVTSLLVSAAVTFGLYVLIDGSPAALYGVYIWSGLVATMTVAQLWLLVGDWVTVTQAKRVFGVIGAGGVVGATTGSLIAERVVATVDPEHLVLGASVAFVLAAAIVMSPGKRNVGRSEERDHTIVAEDMGLLRSQPYLRRLLFFVVTSTVVLTASDYVFKTVVAAEVSESALPLFFARFYVGLNVVALIIQLGVASYLLRALGVNRTLLILPILLLFGAAGVGAGSAFAAVLLLKGADGSLRHSLHRTATEVLYLPLPTAVRQRFKAIIDAVGQRGGQALASLVILGVTAIGAETRHLAMGIGLLSVAWIVSLVDIKRFYLDLFRGNLREGTITTRVSLSDLDLHSLEALMAALNSEQDAEVLTALDLFERHDKASLVPVLLLYHPSNAVVLRTLDLFARAGRTDFEPIARRVLKSDDGELRAAALRALFTLGEDARVLRESLGDADPLVHATALIGLIAASNNEDEQLALDLASHHDDPDAEVRKALASAIRYERDPRFADTLVALAGSKERDVQLEVLRAMLAAPAPQYLDVIIPMLADSRLRPTARACIVALGDVALYYLDEALYDESLPRAVRRHLPRTISRFAPKPASEILLAHLAADTDGGVRFKILRGLGRLRSENPNLALDTALLAKLTRDTFERAVQVLDWRLATEAAQAARPELSTSGGELLVAILREKELNAIERAFRLLGLMRPEEDFALLYQSLTRRDGRARAQSRELLENVLRGEQKAAVLALIDDVDDATRLAAAKTAIGFTATTPSYEERLVSMLEDSSEAVTSVAAYHIAELGLTALTGELEKVKSRGERFLGDVIDRALDKLTPPPEEHHAI